MRGCWDGGDVVANNMSKRMDGGYLSRGGSGMPVERCVDVVESME